MKSFLRSLGTQFRTLNKPARLFLTALFLDGLLFAGWNLFFNLYIIDAGYSRDFLGLVNAAPRSRALLLGVPMGLLSDRMGRKRAMIIGFTPGELCHHRHDPGPFRGGHPGAGAALRRNLTVVRPQPGAVHDENVRRQDP